MKVAVVGATGLVGSTMLKVLEERQFPISELIPVASEKSIGKIIEFCDKKIQVVGIHEAIRKKPDIALFSAGATVSLEFATKFSETGTKVIDNSSAWRMFDNIKLIVPEVNANILQANDQIIANPNCSTIQLVVALKPLYDKYGIKRIVASTYQSVTGTGMKAVNQLMNERKGIFTEKIYPHQIDLNCIPQGGKFESNGYTVEEIKLINETRKILGDHSIAITSTVVRIPVTSGHSISVNVELKNKFDINEIFQLLSEFQGITVLDNPTQNLYPMPVIAEGKDDIFVGRIRRDDSNENSLNMWIVSDNLRKGAATNAIQIAEYLIENYNFNK